jgi:hypothetical protein
MKLIYINRFKKIKDPEKGTNKKIIKKLHDATPLHRLIYEYNMVSLKVSL